MKKLILLLLLVPILSFGQDLEVQWLDIDQRDETIKTVFITDENGKEKVKDFEAKSSIDLIKKFEAKGYEVYKINTVLYQQAYTIKYIIWFRKVNENLTQDIIDGVKELIKKK